PGVSIATASAAASGLLLRPPKRVESLLRGLLDAPAPIGDSIAVVLAPLGDERALAVARRVAADTTSKLASGALTALALAGDLDPLLGALRTGDPKVRSMIALPALKARVSAGPLAPADRDRILTALRDRATDDEPTVRIEALRMIGRLGETPPLDAAIADLESPDLRRVSRALDLATDTQIRDNRATPILARRLPETPFPERWGMAQALGRLRDPAGAPALESQLSDRTVQNGIPFGDYAAIQLSNLGPAGFDALARALDREADPARRVVLVNAIAATDDPRVVDRLRAVATATSEHREVRAAAIRSIPLLRKDGGASILRAMLSVEREPAIRRLLNHVLFDLY
ncbi:MAG TPA: hypothetical protein VKE69_10855, partial [Planctomycetota bacterium]|nr:hypothetical protein [Planctomycetota bacterium]